MVLRDEVYGLLKQKILVGDYRPGDRLNLGDIADELAVSKMPVREALRRLEIEGLVETEASRWTRVTEIDFDEAARLYPVRWAMEAVALQTSRPFTAEEVAGLRAANDRVREGIDSGDWQQASEADEVFHLALVAPCDNPDLVNFMTTIRERLLRLSRVYWDGPPIRLESVHEHDRVIERVAAQDLDGAAEEIAAHWKNSLERMKTHYTPAAPPRAER